MKKCGNKIKFPHGHALFIVKCFCRKELKCHTFHCICTRNTVCWTVLSKLRNWYLFAKTKVGQPLRLLTTELCTERLNFTKPQMKRESSLLSGLKFTFIMVILPKKNQDKTNSITLFYLRKTIKVTKTSSKLPQNRLLTDIITNHVAITN